MPSPPRGRRLALRGIALATAALTAAGAAAAPGAHAAPPNGRAFELVSPAFTGDQLTMTGYGAFPAILDDGKLAYGNGLTVLFRDAGNGWGSIFAAERGATGWVRTQLDAPAAAQNGNAQHWIIDATPDLARTLIYSSAPLPTFTTVGPRFSGPSELTVRSAGGQRTVAASIPYVSPNGGLLIPAGSSDDLRTIAYETDRQLFGDTHEQGNQVYVFRDGQTRVAGVDDDGAPFACGASAVVNYGYSSDSPIVTTNVVSRDGATVVVQSAGAGPDCSAPPQLYAYRDGRTRALSTPDAGVVDPNGTQAPAFVDAAPDGSAVWFVTGQQLTAQDANAGVDLYRADLPPSGGERELTCVSCGRGAGNDAAVAFMPFVAPAALVDEGRRLFFVTGNAIDGVGHDGGQNLFLWEGGALRLVAADESSSVQFAFQATPDGRHLAIATTARLTDPQHATLPTDPTQLYRAAVRDGGVEFACVSCDPTGAPPAESINDAGLARRNRMITDDARSLVFASTAALTPAAVAGLANLYEWRDGTLSLLYTGASRIDPKLVGISRDGRDVYFDTFANLTPDKRQGVDAIYDARLGGGFPAPPVPPAACAGSACRGPVTPPPTLPAAATVSFVGVDEPPATPRPVRGRVRVARAQVRGGAVRVDVRTPGRGRVTVSGPRVRRISRTVVRAGTYRLAATLTRAARRTLTRRGRVAVRLRVAFRPAQGTTSSTTVTVTVKG